VPIYVQATSNGWAFDDTIIIRRNQAAHSLPEAWQATLSPYWPITEAGQYRPLVVWTYAIDWTISGGNPAWFHTTNVILHAVAAALLAVALARWLPPLGAVSAGVIFAWHPVHVEAVANVVGRAELVTAIGLLGAVLAARRYRSEREGGRRTTWAALALGCVLVALLSKEHGVVAVVLIAADEALEDRHHWRTSGPLYVAVVALTAAWFYTWWAVAGRLVPEVVAAPLSGLSLGERIMTMLPAQLEVVRLLTWPANLAADYNPLMVPQRREITWLAVGGLMTSGAIVALGFLIARRAPAIAFGIAVAVATYAPTSNLLFASGVPLAERNLYLAAAATAAVAGWLIGAAANQRMRAVALGAVAVLAAVYATRSIARVPFWHDDQTAVIDEFVSHPENYRNHLRVATMLVDRGDTLGGLAQGMVAARIFPEDAWVVWRVVPWALAAGWDRLAQQEAARAADLHPSEPAFHRLVARVYLSRGHPDSAAAPARRAIELASQSAVVWEWYGEVLDALNAAPWRRTSVEAHVDWIDGRFGQAGRRLHAALAELQEISTVPDCWDMERARQLIVRLRLSGVQARVRAEDGTACRTAAEEPRP
jgi:hypothetical protein